jgi:alkanesulfonate monooxygenase SsuD/methylene tetrahydromethanopterin reductase-like flavin-dependent oxidoreductase (luciferase family)
MLELGLMVEGQNGLTWERWGRLVRAAERLGYAAVYRNDHFMNPSGPPLESLELWSSLTWAATNTERIELGW